MVVGNYLNDRIFDLFRTVVFGKIFPDTALIDFDATLLIWFFFLHDFHNNFWTQFLYQTDTSTYE